MKSIEIDVNALRGAPWNPNRMDDPTADRLRESISRYGLVVPLVVRPVEDFYEVLSGNQRLKAIVNMGIKTVPCMVVKVNDTEAMLLAQVLNGIRGEDDLAMKGALLKKVLESVPEDQVLSLLPETANSLRALSTIGESDLAEQLKAWQDAQAARLSHMQLQLTRQQLETVREAVSLILPKAKDSQSENPNARGKAIYMLCKFYLERRQPE